MGISEYTINNPSEDDAYAAIQILESLDYSYISNKDRTEIVRISAQWYDGIGGSELADIFSELLDYLGKV